MPRLGGANAERAGENSGIGFCAHCGAKMKVTQTSAGPKYTIRVKVCSNFSCAKDYYRTIEIHADLYNGLVALASTLDASYTGLATEALDAVAILARNKAAFQAGSLQAGAEPLNPSVPQPWTPEKEEWLQNELRRTGSPRARPLPDTQQLPSTRYSTDTQVDTVLFGSDRPPAAPAAPAVTGPGNTNRDPTTGPGWIIRSARDPSFYIVYGEGWRSSGAAWVFTEQEKENMTPLEDYGYRDAVWEYAS